MPAEVIPIRVLRPYRRPEELIKATAIVGGALAITVVDAEGDEVDVVLSAEEAHRFLNQVADAIDLAKGLCRG